MKRENLYLVSAALLASTALSTAASAGVFTILSAGAGTNTNSTTTAVRLSAQVFATNPLTSQQIGSAASSLAYRFGSVLDTAQSNFSATIGVTGAQFATAAVSTAITTFNATISSAGVSFIASGSVVCGLVSTPTSLIINNCSPNSADAGSVAGFIITAVAFDNATGLATVGGSISLAGTTNLGGSAGSGAVYDTTAAQAVITSANSLSTTVTAATGVSQINVSATPAFGRLVNGSLTALLSTVNITNTGALAADLSTVISSSAAVNAGGFIRLTSTILSDDAVRSIEIQSFTGGSQTPTQFGAGNVTFTLPQNTIQDSYKIVVNFTGSAAIDVASAGTVDVSFVALAAASTTANNVAPAGVTGGSAAGLSRSGLSININGIQPGIAQGLTYQSFLRIVNSSSTAGAATVVLRNNDTGVVLGTYTSPSIPGSGSVQVSAGNLESGAGITPSASVLYQATVSGAFNGYVQHVSFNPTSGAFSDLSAAPRTN